MTTCAMARCSPRYKTSDGSALGSEPQTVLSRFPSTQRDAGAPDDGGLSIAATTASLVGLHVPPAPSSHACVPSSHMCGVGLGVGLGVGGDGVGLGVGAGHELPCALNVNSPPVVDASKHVKGPNRPHEGG